MIGEGGAFFQPTEAWYQWVVATFGDAHVVDAGCGLGFVVEALTARGVKCVGIDSDSVKLDWAYERVRAFPGLCADVIGHDLTTAQPVVILFLRPNRGTWVREAILAAHLEARCFYVSHPKNVLADLGNGTELALAVEWREVPDLVGVEVGDSGERVYEVRRVPADGDAARDLKLWSLVDSGSDDIRWARSAHGGLRWVNENGGWCGATDRDVVLEQAVTTDPWWLCPTRTSGWIALADHVSDPALKSGWVSPEGVFYRCRYHEHDKLAYEYLRRSTPELEQSGWARVHAPRESSSAPVIVVYDPRRSRSMDRELGRLTAPQVDALMDAGIVLCSWTLEAAEKGWRGQVCPECAQEWDPGCPSCDNRGWIRP
jgi:SAM-dependent methyltransferase